MKTVRDLMNDLESFDPDLPILLAKDEEGNGFHWLQDTESIMVDRTDVNEYFVETVYDRQGLIEEEGSLDDFTGAVVLWP